MKKWLAMVVWAWAAVLQAQQVTLTWDPSPSPGVSGYRIHYGPSSGNYLYVTNVGLVLTQTVVLPHSGRWFFAATALDTNNVESVFSNEIQWEARPLPPRLKGAAWLRLAPELWRSTNRVDWVAFTAERTWIQATNQFEYFAMRGLAIERIQDGPLTQ